MRRGRSREKARKAQEMFVVMDRCHLKDAAPVRVTSRIRRSRSNLFPLRALHHDHRGIIAPTRFHS